MLIPAQANGVVSFFQLTGAALGVGEVLSLLSRYIQAEAVSVLGIINTVQSIYLNKELRELAPDAPFDVVRQSVSAIYTLPVALQPAVIHAYVISITKSLVPIYIALALATIASIFVRNHNMLKIGGVGAMAA